MKFEVILLSIFAAVTLAACGNDQGQAPARTTSGEVSTQPAVAQRPTGPVVSGTVSIGQRPTLPRGLSLVVKLVDVTDPASLPVVVAESTQPASQVLPLNVALAYDPARIDASHSYGLQVTLQAETHGPARAPVLYGTDRPVPVLTAGAPSKGLAIELVRGGQPAVDVPPGEQAMAEFDELAANIGGMRRIHGERLEAEVAVGWDAFVEDSGQIRMAREQVDYGDAGSAQFRYAYKGGKPWVVERIQGRDKVVVGWNESGDVVLDEDGSGQVDTATLYARAESLYAQASAQR